MGRPWIKLSTGMFDDEKIKLIKNMPEGRSILLIWVELLCFAGKTDNDGVFLLTKKIPYNEEMLASIFQENVATVRLALKTFMDFGMMEQIEGAYALPNWTKYQSEAEAIAKAKERNKERQQRWRDRQKKPLLEATCEKRNVTETLRNGNDENNHFLNGEQENVTLRRRYVTPLELEEEKELEKDIYSSCSSNNHKQRKVKDGHRAVSDFYTKNIRPTPSEYELSCLLDLADEYSDEWTIEALKETIKGGGRGLRYTEKILERWKTEGYKSRPGSKKRSGPSTQSQETIDQANEIPF